MARAKCNPHKYHRVNLEYATVMACAAPNCSHHMPKYMEQTLLGKLSICWECNEKFILDERALKMNKPICLMCDLKHEEIPESLQEFINR